MAKSKHIDSYVGYFSDVFDELVYFDEEIEDDNLHVDISAMLSRIKNLHDVGLIK